jgi:uncharacterized LabA/DUF88 family protein
MITEPRPHVFLSHVREDAERVERLAAELEARGIGTWIDRHRIRPGQRWQKAIEDAIRSGAFFVACFSKAFAARGRSYMNEELLLAIEEVRLRPEEAAWFIPIRLDDCAIPERRIGPELSIRSFQWLDMYPDWAQSIERLAEAIRPAVSSAVAVFIDGDWLIPTARQANLPLDFEALLMRLRLRYGDNVAVSLQLSRDRQSTSRVTYLKRLGYAAHLAETKKRGNRVYTDCDVKIALHAAGSTSNTLVIIAGDADLAPVFEHAKQQGKTTILIGIPGCVSAALRDVADDFVGLEEFVLDRGAPRVRAPWYPVHLDPILANVEGWPNVAKAIARRLKKYELADWMFVLRPLDEPYEPDEAPYPDFYKDENRIEFRVHVHPVVGKHNVALTANSLFDFLLMCLEPDDGDGQVS